MKKKEDMGPKIVLIVGSIVFITVLVLFFIYIDSTKEILFNDDWGFMGK